MGLLLTLACPFGWVHAPFERHVVSDFGRSAILSRYSRYSRFGFVELPMHVAGNE